MSPPNPSNETAKYSHEGHTHTKSNFLKHHRHGKKSPSARDNEEAPLLADDAPNDDIEANPVDETPLEQPATKQEKAKRGILKVGHWIWSNKMMLAIMLLLIGGVIALTVYFIGEFVSCDSILFNLRYGSRLSPKITTSSCSYLSQSCLCRCRLRDYTKYVTKISRDRPMHQLRHVRL